MLISQTLTDLATDERKEGYSVASLIVKRRGDDHFGFDQTCLFLPPVSAPILNTTLEPGH